MVSFVVYADAERKIPLAHLNIAATKMQDNKRDVRITVIFTLAIIVWSQSKTIRDSNPPDLITK